MKAIQRTFAGAVALSLGLSLAACGGIPDNRSLYSTKQPVVERANYTLDVAAGPGGLTIPEQQRLAGWFEAMDIGYGDRIAIEDPLMSDAIRADIAALASRHGILVSDGAPITTGYVEPGEVRIVLTRSSAHVPGCPDWSAQSDINDYNATYPGYGCAVHGNLAAMIANPEDLIKGQEGTGETVIMTATKAIKSYRDQAPTGEGGLPQASTGAN